MEGVSSDLLIRAISSLFFIFVVGGAVVWWLKGRGIFPPGGNAAPIKVLARMQIDTRHKLLLVEVEESRFLVGTSSSGIAISPLNVESKPEKFGDHLSKEIARSET